MFLKSNLFYTIGNILKHRYWKWFCIFNLRLQTKSYDQKIKLSVQFPNALNLFPREKAKEKVFFPREKRI
jgi:hypothetical protein